MTLTWNLTTKTGELKWGWLGVHTTEIFWSQGHRHRVLPTPIPSHSCILFKGGHGWIWTVKSRQQPEDFNVGGLVRSVFSCWVHPKDQDSPSQFKLKVHFFSISFPNWYSPIFSTQNSDLNKFVRKQVYNNYPKMAISICFLDNDDKPLVFFFPHHFRNDCNDWMRPGGQKPRGSAVPLGLGLARTRWNLRSSNCCWEADAWGSKLIKVTWENQCAEIKKKPMMHQS